MRKLVQIVNHKKSGRLSVFVPLALGNCCEINIPEEIAGTLLGLFRSTKRKARK